MASMILIASRRACGAARSAASGCAVASVTLNASRGAARSAASRCAAAVCGSGLVVGGAHHHPQRCSMSCCSRSDGPPPPVDNRFYPFKFTTAPDKVRFKALEKDLESDEALWDLYKRWCKAFNQERSLDEMLCRFSRFKQTVLHVDRINKACLPYKLEINWFADGKNMTLVRPKMPVFSKKHRKMLAYSRSRTFTPAGEFEKEPEGAGEFKKEPDGAGSGTFTPAGEFEKEPEGAGECKKEPDGAGEF